MAEHDQGWGGPVPEFPPPVPGYPGYNPAGPGAQYPLPPQYPVGAPGFAPSYPGMPMGYPPPRRTNGLAIASLACSIFGVFCCLTALPGVVMGHIAMSQIKRSGEDGKGLALAGLIIGYVAMAIVVIFFILALIFPAIVTMIGVPDSPTPTSTYSG
jgi:hypothetical protein